VIPIPKLPTLANPGAMHVVPVVRSAPASISPPPRRLAKGTGPYLPKTGQMPTVAAPRRDDDTVPGMVLPPVMPRAAQAVTLPSIVKRASRG